MSDVMHGPAVRVDGKKKGYVCVKCWPDLSLW